MYNRDVHSIMYWMEPKAANTCMTLAVFMWFNNRRPHFVDPPGCQLFLQWIVSCEGIRSLIVWALGLEVLIERVVAVLHLFPLLWMTNPWGVAHGDIQYIWTWPQFICFDCIPYTPWNHIAVVHQLFPGHHRGCQVWRGIRRSFDSCLVGAWCG